MASIGKVATPETEITSIVMPRCAMNSAAHKALYTRELLCNIVTHLPFKGNLAATGVCPEWRAALVGDPNIREDLFLRPAKVRLLLAHENHMRITGSIPLTTSHILGTALPLLNSIFNRTTFAIKAVKFSTSTNRTANSIRHMPVSGFDVANNFWRDMFITQPPCSGISISAYSDTIYDLHDMNFRRARGTKLGELYDLLHSRLVGDYNRYSIVLKVRDWIPEEFVRDRHSLGNRVRCEVHNGEVQRQATPLA